MIAYALFIIIDPMLPINTLIYEPNYTHTMIQFSEVMMAEKWPYKLHEV